MAKKFVYVPSKTCTQGHMPRLDLPCYASDCLIILTMSHVFYTILYLNSCYLVMGRHLEKIFNIVVMFSVCDTFPSCSNSMHFLVPQYKLPASFYYSIIPNDKYSDFISWSGVVVVG